MLTNADISDDGLYRYRLDRVWDITHPQMGFVMLNPSTADGTQDDPTIRKCIGFAKRNNYGGVTVVNLFAWRATNPKELMMQEPRYDIVGPHNNDYIRGAVGEVETLVCAWGTWGTRFTGRVRKVLQVIEAMEVTPKILKFTRGGQPSHPLMLPYSCTLREWVF